MMNRSGNMPMRQPIEIPTIPAAPLIYLTFFRAYCAGVKFGALSPIRVRVRVRVSIVPVLNSVP